MPQLAVEVCAVSKTFRSLWRGSRVALQQVSLAVPRGACFGLAGPSGAGKSTLIGILSARIQPDAGTVTTPRHGIYLSGGSPQLAGRLDEFRSSPPELVVLDEPMAEMEPPMRSVTLEAIRRIHHAGTTVLIASRDLPCIETVCSDLAILHRGEILVAGRTADLSADRGARVAVTALPGRLEEELAASGFLVGLHGNRYWVAAADRARLNELIDRLRAANVSINSIEDLRPSLEQIYLAAAAKK